MEGTLRRTMLRLCLNLEKEKKSLRWNWACYNGMLNAAAQTTVDRSFSHSARWRWPTLTECAGIVKHVKCANYMHVVSQTFFLIFNKWSGIKRVTLYTWKLFMLLIFARFSLICNIWLALLWGQMWSCRGKAIEENKMEVFFVRLSYSTLS